MAERIQIRRDTAANWTNVNPVLANGEMGWETDTGYIKVGDGTTAWNSLAYRIAQVSDTAYDKSTWDGVTGIAPSKNAVRDKVETLALQEFSVADEAEITLATGKTGRGWAMAGDNEEYINFRFTAAGVVTVISNTANAVNTDTDGNLCVYDAGAGIAIKNRLGATKVIRYIVNYS